MTWQISDITAKDWQDIEAAYPGVEAMLNERSLENEYRRLRAELGYLRALHELGTNEVKRFNWIRTRLDELTTIFQGMAPHSKRAANLLVELGFPNYKPPERDGTNLLAGSQLTLSRRATWNQHHTLGHGTYYRVPVSVDSVRNMPQTSFQTCMVIFGITIIEDDSGIQYIYVKDSFEAERFLDAWHKTYGYRAKEIAATECAALQQQE